MKTLKTLFTLLLMTVSMAVSAQTIVAVEKTDGTTDNYNLADVDSVVYEPTEAAPTEATFTGVDLTTTHTYKVCPETVIEGVTDMDSLKDYWLTIVEDSGYIISTVPFTLWEPNISNKATNASKTTTIVVSGTTYYAAAVSSGFDEYIITLD